MSTSHAVEAALLAVVPGIGPVVAAANEWRLRRMERAVASIEDAVAALSAERGEELPDTIRWLAQDRRRKTLTERALDLSLDTEDEEIRLAAARVLRHGLSDDAKIDEARLYLRTLHALEPAHLRLLTFMADKRIRNKPDLPRRAVKPEEMVKAWPEVATVLPGLLHVLQAEGVARRVVPDQISTSVNEVWQIRMREMDIKSNNAERWEATSYGRALLQFAVDDGDAVDNSPE